MFEWDRTSVPVAALEEISVSMRTTANSDAFCDRNVCLAAIAEAADPPRGGIKLDVPKTRSLSVATPEPAEGRGGVTLGIPD